MTWLRAAHATPFGRLEGSDPLSLMSEAATRVLAESGLERHDIDGLICGYATTLPHLMLATLFAETFGLSPRYAHGMQMGGATGAGMIHLARILVASGTCRNVLVVGGENRLTGQSRDTSVQTLAQVGHARGEVPAGATIPAYYALAAARYLHDTGATQEDLAALAVLMRANAARTPGAQLTAPLSVADVMASRPISEPLKLLDCCPISDGGAAVLVSAERGEGPAVRIAGAGQAHTHQHISEAPDDLALGARQSVARAYGEAGIGPDDVGYLAIYDSFTVTLAMLLEAVGLSAPGRAGRDGAAGRFDAGGALPLNTHGGLLSYGHCGVAGAMAHVAEALTQMTGRAGARQIAGQPAHGLVHGDGGVLSSHVSLVLERVS
ncbi:thiolase family protein [Pseudooceanicola sp. 216_PA32_1]|uniref:Thiolase family protein n=1 Tax=Pseudooceanicola pacificus TaxID=2676438 RepID=A0A844WBX9_9RHOB|nr:thiolase family protein [Pseudooceanicola pacificus]MWB78753.1 thiolase family protein [Pseudooceanicola pacificus]